MTIKHQSYWIDTASHGGSPHGGFETLSRDELEVDVAIVGGGISGITAATLLKRAGMTVAVIEKGRVGAGETGHTTAHLTAIQDVFYHELKRSFGLDGAREAMRSSCAAITQIEKLVRSLAIDCGFRRLPAFLYTENREDVPELRKEWEAMEEIGLKAHLESRAPLPFSNFGAIRVEHQAQFHPLRYLERLAERIPGDGSHVFENTQATSLRDGNPCEVVTDRGSVRASCILSMADSPAASAYLLQTLVYPYRTYALGARVARPVDLGGLFYDMADPYHYLRMHDDLLIVGGKDHKVGMMENTERPFGALEEYVRARFEVRAIEYRWSGQVLNPADGLPYIGRSPFARNVYVATGFSGTGMTFGTLSGMILSDLVLGRKNPWASLYDPGRIKPIASAREFVTENVDYPKCLVEDWAAPADARSVGEIARGQGKTVRQGLKKVAVYRDEGGALRSVSAVCPHLGCIVRFNQAEKSWDCPCHGSRFATDGKLLHGPALTGLKPVELDEEGSEEGAEEEKAA